MKKINYSNLYEIKNNLKKKALGGNIYKEMNAILAIEFKRYINAWLENPNVSWEEFSIKNVLLSQFGENKIKELDFLDKLSSDLYYNESINVFRVLKEINLLESKVKQLENEAITLMSKAA